MSAEKEIRGIRCPKCGCPDTRVVRTLPIGGTWRGHAYQRIRRYRMCRNCGHSFPTTEDYTEGMLETKDCPALPRIPAPSPVPSPGVDTPRNPYL